MKVLKWALGIVAVLAVVFFAGAALIDPKFHVERSAAIAAPPAKVYPLVATPKAWPQWAVWNKRDPNMTLAFSGPESGKGAKWSWVSKSEGSGEMEFTDAEPDKSVTYALSFPDFGMRSTGQLILTPEGQGTRVRWTNAGDVGSSPMARWFVPFFDKMIGPDFEAGLAGLKALAEKS
jgi:uncharacterized protein YndB with AHSA1/START domain